MIYQAIKKDLECPVGSFEVIFESETRELVEKFAEKVSRDFPVTVYCKDTNVVLGGYGWDSEND